MKNWYQSKTIWVAVITIVTGVLTWVGGQIEAGASVTALGLIQVLLRLVTTTGILGVENTK